MKSFFYCFFICLSFTMQAQKSTIRFSAQIQNRNSDTLYIIGRPPENFKYIMVADGSGRFSGAFTATKEFYILRDGKERITLFLKKGYDLTMTVDAAMFDETLHFEGNGAIENNFLARKFLADEAFEKQADLLMAQPAALKNLIAAKTKKTEEDLHALKTDADFRRAMESQIQNQKGQLLMHAQKIQKNAALENNFMPPFNYENYKGGTTQSAALKGKYLYIDIWATWCAPCRTQIPYLKQLEERYKNKNITFVSISIDVIKDRNKWKKFIEENTLGGTQLLADKAWQSDFIKEFGINSIPRFILVSPNGTVLNADALRPSDPVLQQQLDTLLK